MKQYSLKELKSKASEHFAKLKVNTLFATSDGQFFLEENRAMLHATPNKLSMFPLVNELSETQPTPPKTQVKATDQIDTHGDNTPEKSTGQSEPNKEGVNTSSENNPELTGTKKTRGKKAVKA